MTLTINDLSPEAERLLKAEAGRAGVGAAEYARQLIERDLLAGQTFGEILRPIRADFKRRGVTEEQLDAIVDRARKATRPTGKKARR